MDLLKKIITFHHFPDTFIQIISSVSHCQICIPDPFPVGLSQNFVTGMLQIGQCLTAPWKIYNRLVFVFIVYSRKIFTCLSGQKVKLICKIWYLLFVKNFWAKTKLVLFIQSCSMDSIIMMTSSLTRKQFPFYWPYLRDHQSLVVSSHKEPVMQNFMSSLLLALTSCWTNSWFNRNLRRHAIHVMSL